MRHREIHRQKQKLDALFEKTKEFSHDIEIQSHWARYLCVLVSGFLETAVRTTFIEHAKTRSSTTIANYVSRQLDRFSSASMGNIISLTSSFNAEWGDTLQQATEGELKASVDSVVAIRHQIAHGRDTGISYTQLYQYYQDIVKVVELLEHQCE
jgi:hypothetical protein